MSRELFEQARRHKTVRELVERTLNVQLARAGKEMRGQCPICGAGKSSRSAFAVTDDRWRCYGSCDAGGDIVDLEQRLNGGSPVEAARRILGLPESDPVERAAEPVAAPRGPKPSDQVALELWREARPFLGTLGERYLLSRRVLPEVIAAAAPNLRYHPFAKHHWDDTARGWVKAPAMVAQVVTPSGPTGGVHVTYLARTGGKAALEPAKRMWGPQTDGEGRPGGAWLIGPEGRGGLLDAEGIETVLSMASIAWPKDQVRAVAALSLNRLQGGILRDDEGCIDVFAPRPDPARPAFVWPRPLVSPWPWVAIGVDRDMSAVRVRARTGRGKVTDFLLEAEARARICARLAVTAWAATGVAARAIAPPPMADFNDELRRRARGAAA